MIGFLAIIITHESTLFAICFFNTLVLKNVNSSLAKIIYFWPIPLPVIVGLYTVIRLARANLSLKFVKSA